MNTKPGGNSHMNPKLIVIVLGWIGTVAAAYFIGAGGAKPPASSAGPMPTPAQDHALAVDAESRSAQRLESTTGEEKKPKENVRLLIAKARLAMGNGMGGMMNIRMMLRAIAPIAELDDSQLQEALAEVETSVKEPQQKMMFYSLLLGQWAEKDGRAAMKYAEEKLSKGSMMNIGITASVLGSWAHADPEGVWKWLETERVDDGNNQARMMAVSSVFAGMAANNLDTALLRVGTLDEQSRSMALNGIAQSASDDASRQRLLDRAVSLPADQRNQLRQTLASQWAMSDPNAAVAWIHSLPAEEQKPVRESAAQMMLMMNPTLGADLMMEGADDKTRPQLYDRVVMQWAMNDPSAAGAWLTKQPQGPELDGARATYARTVAPREPSAAMDWAMSVQDATQRSDSIGMVYQLWHAKDPAAADAALGASGLSVDQINSIRAAQPKP